MSTKRCVTTRRVLLALISIWWTGRKQRKANNATPDQIAETMEQAEEWPLCDVRSMSYAIPDTREDSLMDELPRIGVEPPGCQD